MTIFPLSRVVTSRIKETKEETENVRSNCSIRNYCYTLPANWCRCSCCRSWNHQTNGEDCQTSVRTAMIEFIIRILYNVKNSVVALALTAYAIVVLVSVGLCTVVFSLLGLRPMDLLELEQREWLPTN